jgi:hypothetical protein
MKNAERNERYSWSFRGAASLLFFLAALAVAGSPAPDQPTTGVSDAKAVEPAPPGQTSKAQSNINSGDSYLRTREYAKAIQYYSEAIELTSSPDRGEEQC